MNYHQFKQYIFNNLLYGENERPRREKTLLPVALIQPDYKRTWGIDISPWDGVVDLAKTKALGASFVFIKGMDGTIQSKYFVENHTTARTIRLRQAPYHWLYRNTNVSCVAQAQALHNLIQKYAPDMPALIDFETTYWGGAAASPNFDDLRKFMVEFLRLGNQKPYLYSGKYFMNQYGQIPNDLKAMFAGLHIANYGVTAPGLPLGYTSWQFWQFSDIGDAQFIAPGTTNKKELDLNYTTLAFVTPPSDVITNPYDGMTRISGFRNGWYFELFKLDPRKYRFELVSTSALETVPSVSGRKGAILATNAGEWVRETLKPQDWTVSNGGQIVVRDTQAARPSLQIGDGWAMIDHLNETGAQQAFTGLRYLVSQSTIQPYLFGNETQYVEGHARTCFGVDAGGSIMILLSEGVYPNQGLKLSEAAQVLQQYGAVTAFDGGGGGDSGGVLNGKSLIKPENIVNGANVYRALPMTFCIYGEKPMPTRYEARALDANTRLRPDHNTNNVYLGLYPAGTKFHGDELFIAPISLPLDGTKPYQLAGDKWLKVTDVNGTAVNGWVAITNLGLPICTLVDSGTVPPPPVETKPELNVTIEAAGYPVTKVNIKPL